MRNLLVAAELELELAGAAGKRAQAGGVIGDLCVRDGRLDRGRAGRDAVAGAHALDAAAASRHIAHHGAGVAVGHGDGKVCHRLEKHGLCLVDCLLEADARRGLEGHLVGVDGVIRALVDGDLDVDHRVAGEHAVLHGLLDALVDGGDEAARNVAADDLIDELVTRAGVRLDAEPTIAVLAGAAGLLLVAALGGGDSADGLAVRDAQGNGVRRHAGARLEAVEQDADLRLADGGDDGLAGVLVTIDLEGRVCVSGLLEEGVELALGSALIGLDGNAVERVGEAERGGLDLAGHAEGVARLGLELGNDDDVASGGGRDVRGVLAAHEIQVTEALGLTRAGVGELDAGGKGACQDLEEGKAAVLRVVQGLEGKGDGTVVVGRDVKLLAVNQRDAAEVCHGREPRDDGIHEGDDALLLDAAAREHGDKDALGDGLGQQALELVLRDLLALEVLHHDLVVGLGNEVGELRAGVFGSLGIGGGDVGDHGLAALEVAGLHVNDVDDALEGVAGAHGDGDLAKLVAKALLQSGEREVIVGVGAIDAVDEDGAREREVLGGIPQTSGHSAGAACGVDHEQRGLASAHRGVGIADEVRIARSVENVDAGALPLDGSDRGRDRESALAFLAVVIQRGLSAGVASQTGGAARQVKHGLGQHGLAHAALAHKDHVLHAFWCFCCHDASFVGVVRVMQRTLLQTIPT